ncbi:DNA-directed RNA polymerase I subunit RPA12-like isoform X2 [Physella acuta]|nr:DNA-directed RNA polymerase I subunit RPA12-like [Physella acuta]XP_059176308.1 DNA-directed RNA polymerase I subunit RPA12-like isoform X2 [Physella acuta]XP_059176309.1 DNA-directed RNA polymerase I subunit RPA12-like isoform X2 [Physella acuta]
MSEPPPFTTDLQFCPFCGSVLPLPSIGQSIISCARCPATRNLKEYQDVTETFIIHFNAPKRKQKKNKEAEDLIKEELIPEFQGPTVERQCSRCNHDIMIYTTRQTRSADEGQTVFYTCVKCKFQDIEYS